MSPQKQVDESTSLERDFRQAVSSLKLTFRQRMPIQEYAKQDLAAIQTSPVGDIVAVIRSQSRPPGASYIALPRILTNFAKLRL
jgi:hypothetical protein